MFKLTNNNNNNNDNNCTASYLNTCSKHNPTTEEQTRGVLTSFNQPSLVLVVKALEKQTNIRPNVTNSFNLPFNFYFPYEKNNTYKTMKTSTKK